MPRNKRSVTDMARRNPKACSHPWNGEKYKHMCTQNLRLSDAFLWINPAYFYFPSIHQLNVLILWDGATRNKREVIDFTALSALTFIFRIIEVLFMALLLMESLHRMYYSSCYPSVRFFLSPQPHYQVGAVDRSHRVLGGGSGGIEFFWLKKKWFFKP